MSKGALIHRVYCITTNNKYNDDNNNNNLYFLDKFTYPKLQYLNV